MGGPAISTAGRAPLSGLHDVELAQLATTGDRAAFGELARRHGSAVRALLRRMGCVVDRATTGPEAVEAASTAPYLSLIHISEPTRPY